MIDWISGTVPCAFTPDIPCDRMMRVDHDGVVLLDYALPGRLEEPSGSTSMRITARGRPGARGEIYVSVNPLKFIQGHNVWGPCTPRPLIAQALRQAAHLLGTHEAGRETPWGACLDLMKLTRVDCTHSWLAPSPEYVNAWLKHCANVAIQKHNGRCTPKHGTLYWGQGSKRIAMKMYHKGQEIRDAMKEYKIDPDLGKSLLPLADKLLRVEVTARTPWLREQGLEDLSAWDNEYICQAICQARLFKLELPENKIQDAHLENVTLPPRLKVVYIAWKTGADLANIMTRATWYRYRAEFKKFNIDIDIASPVSNTTFSLRDIFCTPPVDFPAPKVYDNGGYIAELIKPWEAHEVEEDGFVFGPEEPLHASVSSHAVCH